MKQNIDVVPMLFFRNRGLSGKMAYGFWKMGRAALLPKADYGRDHLKNLCLVYFKLTPLCNLHCVMCGQQGIKGILKGPVMAEESKTIIPLERYKEIVDELAPRRPIIYLWGGEPFLYPDLLPLVRYMVNQGLYVSVNTNGTLLEKHAAEIVRDRWSTLFVSLDAFRDVNDAIRGQGSYDRVVRGIEAINREKSRQGSTTPVLGIVTTVTNMNYLYLDQLAEAARDFGLGIHIFNLGTYTNDAIVEKQRRFMKERLDTDIYCLEAYNTGFNEGIDSDRLYNILRGIHRRDYGHPIITVPALNPKKIHQYYAELEVPVRNRCIVPWCQANINYNGDVHFCADYPEYVLGNIREQSFAEIYNGERANRFRRVIHGCDGGILPGCLRCYQNMLFGRKTGQG